ncbi:YhgE/Pip domain-containing protein [Ureibacillus sp. FSL K6-2830]|uniref:YhgE/Pip domain-containing protein n=1 Tax=Ureibacillus sp. FSL K6-2830 TaxID=2954610 RepID=UPI0030FA5DDC
MKDILNIFKTDVNNIRRNKAAIVVIVALMILPSMYAWFNIIPSWDPYENTEGVSVAVANLDEGSEVRGEKVNVGNEIVLSLLENKKLGWEFVDEAEAMKGVEQGDYYAAIIIPKDFSEKLTSVLTDEPEKPELSYYINEKVNAIAPKVTGAGASGIVESIQSGFVKVANEAIFTAFNEVGIELEVNRPSIEKIRDSIYRLEGDLPEIERVLGVADTDLEHAETAIEKANEGMVKAREISDQAEKMSEEIEKVMRDVDKSVRTYVPLVKQDLRLAQKVIQQIPDAVDRVSEKGTDIDRLLDKISEGTGKIDDGTAALQKLADLLEESDQKLTEERKIEEIIDTLNSEHEKMDELKGNIKEAIDKLEKGENVAVDLAVKIDEMTKDLEQRMADITNTYETIIIPRIEKDIEAIRQQAPKVKDTLVDLQKVNTSVIDQITKWEENGGLVDTTQYKEKIETILPVVDKNLSRVETLLAVFTRVNDISGGRLLEKPIASLTNLQDQLTSASELLTKTLKAIERGEEVSPVIWNTLKQQFEKVDQRLDEVINYAETTVVDAFDEAIANLQKIDSEISSELDRLKETAASASELADTLLDVAKNPEKTIKALKNMTERIDSGQNAIQSLVKFNEGIQQRIDQGVLLDGAERLEQMQKDLQAFKSTILQFVENTRQSKENIGKALTDIKDKSRKMDNSITELIRFIDDELMPKYEKASERANNAIKEGNRMLAKANATFPKVDELLGKAEEGLNTGKDGLKKAHEVFPEVKEKVIEMANRIRNLEEKGDLDQLIDLMKNDPNVEGDFFADPILLKEHELFPIPNYGSAMSPFFTAMSLWVGALILVSSLIVDVPNKHRYKSYEAYFGRFLTFWSIGLMQAFVVTMGDMFLLKTFVAHKFMFVLFGFLISTTFVTIVYTLVSVFGNTGKVIAIVLLVMQLGASGGTFPIQMTPAFFQKIHAFLPFTHALGLFREAVGGIIWPVVWKHIAWLLGYMGVFLFIGIKLKERINKSSDKFLAEARESKVIL